ncbi:MAG: TIGR04282 family arsenosugar biosynthesis glycosyltransferase [Polyangiaceae bacterium]
MTLLFPHGHIVVFAKEPRPGRVKTRLRSLTDAQAAEFARAGLLDTLSLASEIAPTTLEWDGAETAVPALEPPLHVRLQSGGDLGQRMGAAFAASLAEGSAWVVALGTDSPGLPRTALEEASAWLEQPGTPRAVLGPTEDGGYYLLGLSSWQPGLLDDLPWSQPTTRAATRARLESRGYACREVEPYFDVDVPEDLERLARNWRAGALKAPATGRWLERWLSARDDSPPQA